MTQIILISGNYGIYVKRSERLAESFFLLQVVVLLETLHPGSLKNTHCIALAALENSEKEIHRLKKEAKRFSSRLILCDVEGYKIAAADHAAVFRKISLQKKPQLTDLCANLQKTFAKALEKE